MNPFREAIVASPWKDAPADVPEIHGLAFKTCLEALASVRQHQQTTSLLIHGQAGSGKTHLLGRLRASLEPRAELATDRPESLYVWVRLQTSPRMIWRTLRRTLVEDWFRRVRDGHNQFQRILFHRLAEIRVAEGDLVPWYEFMLDQDPKGLAEMIERIAVNLHLDHNTAIAFMHIAFGRHERSLRAWLAGSSLNQETLDVLGLTQEEHNDEEHEEESRRVVLMLCHLAGPGLPIVLSFDQVEALQMRPNDSEALFAFGQLISTLHDNTDNLLMVSCVQSSFAAELKAHARSADYDRLLSFGSRSLDPLLPEQALHLIARRLEGTPFVGRGTWPLTQEEFDQLFRDGAVSPRKLLSQCAAHFDAARQAADRVEAPERADVVMPEINGGATAAIASCDPQTWLGDRWEAICQERLQQNTPDQTDEIVRVGLPSLLQQVFPQWKPTPNEHLQDISLVFEEGTQKLGVSVCAIANMTTLNSRLKRVKTQFGEGRLQRLVIIRDARLPITPTARGAKKQLEELEQQGAGIIYPSTEVLAALDALRVLLADAKSGDLNCEGTTLSPQNLEDWLRHHLAQDLREFAEQILGTSSTESGVPSNAIPEKKPIVPQSPLLEALSDLVASRPILALTEAAQLLSRSPEEIVIAAKQHPQQFGILGEPPLTLFRMIKSSPVNR